MHAVHRRATNVSSPAQPLVLNRVCVRLGDHRFKLLGGGLTAVGYFEAGAAQ